MHDVQWSYSGLEFAVVYGCILRVFLVFLLLSAFQLLMACLASV